MLNNILIVIENLNLHRPMVRACIDRLRSWQWRRACVRICIQPLLLYSCNSCLWSLTMFIAPSSRLHVIDAIIDYWDKMRIKTGRWMKMILYYTYDRSRSSSFRSGLANQQIKIRSIDRSSHWAIETIEPLSYWAIEPLSHWDHWDIEALRHWKFETLTIHWDIETIKTLRRRKHWTAKAQAGWFHLFFKTHNGAYNRFSVNVGIISGIYSLKLFAKRLGKIELDW